MTTGTALLSRYRATRVAVTGASGFIGRWVARSLSALGADVQLVVRDVKSARRIFDAYGVAGTCVEADLQHTAAVSQLFQDLRPAVTFNLAGYGVDPTERDKETAHLVNSRLVGAICDGLAEAKAELPPWPGQRIVHAGSALEYGTIAGDLNEDSVAAPTTLYGKTKLAGTELLKQRCVDSGLAGLTARLFTVYGPGEHSGRLVPSLLECAATGQPLPLTSGTQRRDFTYVEDVAEGLLRLGAVPPVAAPPTAGYVVNLATGKLTSVRRFVSTAGAVLGMPESRLLFGALPTRTAEMEHDPVCIDRLKQLTGWVPSTGPTSGIEKTQRWRQLLLNEETTGHRRPDRSVQ